MAQKTIELGTAPDGMDGDDARTAFQKTNDNFTELYQGVGGAQPASPKLSAIASMVWQTNQILIATGAQTLGGLLSGAIGRSVIGAETVAQGRSALALGTAAVANLTTSSTDPTAGRALKVGDFGLGGYGPVVLSDTIQTLVNSGIYYCNSAGGANLPVASNGFLFVHAQSGLYCKQVFSHVTDGRSWERYLVNGTWGNWDQLLKSSQLVSSAGDTVIGRILTVGYMGLGARVGWVASNANTATYNGFYQGNGAGSTNYMPGTSTAYGPMLVLCRDSSVITQMATFASNPAVEPELCMRGSGDTGSTWGNWRKFFHNGNIVGTASQAGGVPTGAIIEQGANANGSYTKFADGTAILRAHATTTTLQANGAVGTSVLYPISLSAASPISPSATCEPTTSWDHSGVIGCSAVGTANMSVVIKNGGTAQVFTIRWQVTGRWF